MIEVAPAKKARTYKLAPPAWSGDEPASPKQPIGQMEAASADGPDDGGGGDDGEGVDADADADVKTLYTNVS